MPAETSSTAASPVGGTLQRVEETATVRVREIVTGRVRVSTTTEAIEQVVRQDLQGMRADIVRVPIDRTLDPGETPPIPRTEGGVTIIPVFEEILVIETRLHLREEVHVSLHPTVEAIEVPVTLRRQQVVAERLTEEDPAILNKD